MQIHGWFVFSDNMAMDILFCAVTVLMPWLAAADVTCPMHDIEVQPNFDLDRVGVQVSKGLG